ncbi:MAG: hypothetical protein JWM19_5647 [Actinomycetia bacterium]|nr:hypothetical protein [Actinomycetes bacterium]
MRVPVIIMNSSLPAGLYRQPPEARMHDRATFGYRENSPTTPSGSPLLRVPARAALLQAELVRGLTGTPGLAARPGGG